MDQLKAQWESLKEKIRAAWAETQERPWFIAVKERYQELPPAGQQGILYGIAAVILMALIFLPISNLMDAGDQNDHFDERRTILKELLRVQRDLAAAPNVMVAPPPNQLKAQMDGKITAAGVKPEQIKASNEVPTQTISGAEQHGFQYRIDRLTVRQAIDLAYELEHTDPGFKLQAMDLAAELRDPHFYDAHFTIVSFAPKVAQAEAPGEGIANAVKGRGAKGGSASAEAPPAGAPAGGKALPPPPSAPSGAAPAIPNFKRGG